MDTTSEEVCSTRIIFPRKSSASSTRSGSERCRQELDDYDVDFDVRPPSGTNHQQPGKHLSIDTRFSELSLENSSLIAESERDPPFQQRTGTSGSVTRNKTRPSRVQSQKGNFYITSPFKQGPEKDAKGPTLVVDPSHNLKQRTIVGVTKVKRQLENEKRTRYLKLHQSQLQRGNLKSLGRPMTASGPAMSNCQGIVAGSRSYHGFARRQTQNSLADGKCSRQFSKSDVSNTSRPDSLNQRLRPKSSIHNTSCASSVDAANEDSDGSFSEDDSEDSIDIENQEGDLRDNNKNVPSKKDLKYSSAVNGGKSKPSGSCRPEVDPYNSKGPYPDDDSDKEEGRWARQANQSDGYHGVRQSIGCHGDRGRGNVTSDEQQRSGSNTAQGKQRKFRISGDEEETCRRSSSEFDVADDLVDCLNISAAKKAYQKGRNSAGREKIPFESRQFDQHKTSESLSSPSRVNAHKGIDVHINVWEGQQATRVGRKGSLRRFDENREHPVHGITRDFPKEEDSDDFLESDALDSDRIPSADIFKVLDKLNLSTSAMKPPTPRGVRPTGRRVQSAGHTRRKPPVDRGEKPLAKRGKSARPASAKQARRRKSENTDCLDSTEINTASPLFARTDGLITNVSEKLPGYFTEQYRKILDEKNANSKQMSKENTEVASSNSLALVAKEITEPSRSNDDEKHDQTVQANVISDCKEGKSFLNSERPGSDKVDTLNGGQDRYSKRKSSSRSSLSGVFVTMDDKSELRSGHDVDDSSSGVETMSCVTDCSSFERFGDALNKSKYNSPREFRGRDTFDSGIHRQDHNDDDEEGLYYDEIDDGDVGDEDDLGGGGENDNDGDDGYIDDFDDNVSNLEVVAEPKPLSESRYVKQKKPIAPFPPVCFSINARAPEGYLYYFAYGPDMNPNRMAIYLRREPKTRLWGILFGFQLRFNKRGTSKEAGGFPNVEFNPEHSVEGCVYAITDTELAMLDNCMGYPKHYTRAVFPVWMLNSTSPSQHGVAQFCVPAVLYVAQDEWFSQDSPHQKLDCSYSVSQCLKASDILTPNYVQFLTSQASS